MAFLQTRQHYPFFLYMVLFFMCIQKQQQPCICLGFLVALHQLEKKISVKTTIKPQQ